MRFTQIIMEKGIMSEALQRVLKYGFESLGLNEIVAFTHRLNEASKNMLLRNQFLIKLDRSDQDNSDNVILAISKFEFD